MKLKITLIALFIGLSAISQSKFESGYFILKNGTKINCFIKNEGWFDSPSLFSYKQNINSEVIHKNVNEVKEFSIKNKVKFIKRTVDIDRSSSKIENLHFKRTSSFKKEDLLLRVLIEGNTSLYSYFDNGLKRFFYKKRRNKIIPLEYKLFLISKKSIGKNLNYKLQLKKELVCDNLSSKKTKYRKADLVDYFKKYNNCKGDKYIDYTTTEKKGKFNIYGKVSVGTSSLIVKGPRAIGIDFGSKSILKIGVEFEYIIGFKSRKWAFFIEPTFNRTFSSTQEFTPYKTTINYTTIELPLGVKHYIHFKNNNKMFMNTGIIIDFPLSSQLRRLTPITGNHLETVDIGKNGSFFIGTGYNIKNKFTIELRYNFSKNFFESFQWKSDFTNYSIKVGYKL